MTDELDIEALLEAPFRQKKADSQPVALRHGEARSRSRSRSRSQSRPRSRSRSKNRRSRPPTAAHPSRQPHSRSPERHSRDSGRRHRYSRSRSPTARSPSSHSRSRHPGEFRERNDNSVRHRTRDEEEYGGRSYRHGHGREQEYERRHHHQGRGPSDTGRAPQHLLSEPPMLTEAQRDRRTVFCRQLAQRCDSPALKEFCEQAGKVRDARIVYDKISKRSKGVAYVEFYEEESVPLAVALTGKKLLGIPIVVELTETEKNRLAEEAAAALRQERLQQKLAVLEVFIANLHPSILDADLKRVFEPFGDVTFVQVTREDVNRSTAIIQFRDPSDARQAGEKMSGFELAGRPIRLIVRDATVNIANREGFAGTSTTTTAAAVAAGERMAAAASDAARNRDLGLDEDGLASSAELMLRLARDASVLKGLASSRPSPCILLQHMYNPAAETEPDWELEIAEEVQEECGKFGKIEHLHVPKTLDGDVFVRFASTDSAQATVASLNGRWFGGMQVVAMFIPQNEYLTRYPK